MWEREKRGKPEENGSLSLRFSTAFTGGWKRRCGKAAA
jgi:hypothetical protein